MRAFVTLIIGVLLAACSTVNPPADLTTNSSTPITENASAIGFIPAGWRERVRLVGSVRLGDHCVDLREISGTPPAAARQAFLYQCSSAPQFALGDETLHWLDGNSLEEVSATALPHMFWRSSIAVLNGDAFASFDGPDIRLLSSDGQFSNLPRPTGTETTWSRDLSPSGRFFLRMTRTEFLVIDGSSNNVVFRTPTNAPYYLVRQSGSGLQLVGSNRQPDCASSTTCPSDVIVLDSSTGEIHRIAVPNGVGAVVPRPYGERQVIVATEPPTPGTPRGVAIIDLDRLAVVWSGPMLEAPPANAFMCGPLEFEGESRDLTLALHVSLNGSGFVLQRGESVAPTRCAVTGDGRRLAVVSPPFMHVYEIN